MSRKSSWVLGHGIATILLFLTVGVLAGAAVLSCRRDSVSLKSGATDAERLYAEGRERLRRLDGVGARDRLAEAVTADPANALAHAALAEAWTLLGHDAEAMAAARQARDSSDGLSETGRRVVEGRFYDAGNDWEGAIESYSTLFDARPGDVDYGWWLARAQTRGGDPTSALETVSKLRRLPPPASEDPRVDLAEAAAYLALGDPRASRSAAERAMGKGRAAGAASVVGRARLHQALALQEQGEGAAIAVMAALDEARALFAASGDRRALAQALQMTAYTLYTQGDLKSAQDLYEQVLADYREIGDRDSAAGALLDLGSLAIDQGRLAQGETLYHQGLALYRQVGAHYDVAAAMTNLGVAYHLRWDLVTALDRYHEALALCEELGDAEGSAFARVNLAEVHFLRGDLEQARALHEEGLEVYRAIGDRAEVAYGRLQLGKVFTDRADLFLARDSYLEAIATQSRIGEATTEAQTRVALAELVLAAGDPVLAESLALRAEEMLSIEGAVDLAALADTVLARALLAQGKLAAARAASVEARQIAERSGDRRLRFAAAVAAALVRAVADGEKTAALAELEALRAEADAKGLVRFARQARRAAQEIENENGVTATSRHPA